MSEQLTCCSLKLFLLNQNNGSLCNSFLVLFVRNPLQNLTEPSNPVQQRQLSVSLFFFFFFAQAVFLLFTTHIPSSNQVGGSWICCGRRGRVSSLGVWGQTWWYGACGFAGGWNPFIPKTRAVVWCCYGMYSISIHWLNLWLPRCFKLKKWRLWSLILLFSWLTSWHFVCNYVFA